MERKRYYQVYKHTNTINNKVYIGITSWTWQRRWRSGSKGSAKMKNAILKYGDNVFIHEILFQGLTKEEAEQKEIELIKQYHSDHPDFGYNISSGGNSHSGCTQTPEARLKISRATKGHKVSAEARAAISKANKGKAKPNSFKQIKHQQMLGNNYNTFRKVRHGGRKTTTAIIQCDLQGNEIQRYPSVKSASLAVGTTSNHIFECLNGKRKTTKNFIWKKV